MASRTRARINNLNDRAREVGAAGFLTLQDIDALKAFYDFTCLKCGTRPAISPDHVKPLSAGGANTVENIQLLCEPCNKSKGDAEIDYRQGRILTPDYVADFVKGERDANTIEDFDDSDQRRKTNKRHNWDAIRFDFESDPVSTLDSVADKHGAFRTLVYKRSAAEHWVKSKKTFGRNLVERAEQDVQSAVSQRAIDKELSARGLLFDVIEQAVQEWQAKPRATLGDLAQLLKLGLVAQGEPSERVENNVSERPDTNAILARVNRIFDGGEEERTYTPLGLDREEPSAGYTD